MSKEWKVSQEQILLDQFAVATLPALINMHVEQGSLLPERLAEDCYKIADAMMQKRNERMEESRDLQASEAIYDPDTLQPPDCVIAHGETYILRSIYRAEIESLKAENDKLKKQMESCERSFKTFLRPIWK